MKRNFSMAILDSIAIEKKMYWFPLQWNLKISQNNEELLYLRKRFLWSVDQYVFAPPWNCAEPEFIIAQPPLYWLPICFIEINEICSRYCPICSNFMFANIIHFDPLYFDTSLITNSNVYFLVIKHFHWKNAVALLG